MADLKTSAETAATALTGAELVRVVQGGASARTTAQAIANLAPLVIDLAIGDETTAITAGTAKLTTRALHAMTITGVRASLSTAQTSGASFTVDINVNGVSILSTKLTIDNTERTSLTAAAAAVLSATALADDDEITVDVDQVGDGTAKGLKVAMIGVPA